MSEFAKSTAPLRALRVEQPRKFWAKVQRTFWGLLIVGLAIWGLAIKDWPVYLGVVLVFAGAIVVSGEIVLSPLKAALGFGKDVLKAVKGQQNGG